MLIVLEATPRTVEAPPGPGSHILPTPGQTPLVAALDDNVRLADVHAAAVVDDSAMNVPARIIVAIANESAEFPSLINLVQNILTPSPCDRIVQS
jgi:hypothetical protein